MFIISETWINEMLNPRTVDGHILEECNMDTYGRL